MNNGQFKKGQIPWNKGIKGYRKGYKHTTETKNKISQTRKRLGLKPKPYKRNPNIIKICEMCQKKFEVVYSRKDKAKYCSNKCRHIGLKGNKPWNTNKILSNSYGACHDRIRKLRGTPSACEECGTTKAKKYEWANISGKYRNINDYKRLCSSCHSKLDNKIVNITKANELKDQAEKL